MRIIQKELSPLTIFGVILLLFVILNPRLNLLKQNPTFDGLVKSTQAEKKFNPTDFWQYREFSSMGNFVINKDGLGTQTSENFIKKSDLDINRSKIDRFFSIYQSSNIESLDGIANEGKIKEIINWNSLKPEEILYEDSRSIIYKDSYEKTRVIFLTDLNEMRKTNGYFKYDGEDKKTTEGKYWISISLINY